MFLFYHRSTVDVNRERHEGTQSCTNAEAVFDNYHNLIDDVIKGLPEGRRLLLDLHGQVIFMRINCKCLCLCLSIFTFLNIVLFYRPIRKTVQSLAI